MENLFENLLFFTYIIHNVCCCKCLIFCMAFLKIYNNDVNMYASFMQGIDLGNLQAVIAVARNRGIDVICNEVSNRATP